MRKFLIVTLALMLVLGLSGVALAHSVTIIQDALYNFAFVGQYDDFDCDASVDQLGPAEVNAAVVVQTAPDAIATIDQSALLLNFALVEQTDTDVWTGWLTIEQKVEELADMFYFFVLERDVEWPGYTP